MKEICTKTAEEVAQIVEEWLAIFQRANVHLEITNARFLPPSFYDDEEDIKAALRKEWDACGREYDEADLDSEIYSSYSHISMDGHDGLVSDVDEEWLTVGVHPYVEEYIKLFVEELRKGRVAEITEYHHDYDTEWIITESHQIEHLDIREVLSVVGQWADYLETTERIVFEWRLRYDYPRVSCSAAELEEVIYGYESKDHLEERTLETLKGLFKSMALEEIERLERMIYRG